MRSTRAERNRGAYSSEMLHYQTSWACLGVGLGLTVAAAAPASRAAAQGMNAHPSVSPDGRLIAFDSDRTGNGDIYVMNADGSEVVRLTSHPAMEMGGEWWDDGRAIAFARYEGGSAPTWYLVDRDGSNSRRLEDPRRTQWARSPDGRLELVGALYADEPPWIWVRDVDGGNRRPVAEFRDGSFNSDMSFSPDGRHVLFESFIGEVSNAGVYVVPIEGGVPLRLATGTDPAWSPDGARIAFKFHDPETDRYWLHVMNSDGSGDRILAEGSFPRWFPDGRRLAFMAAVDGGWQIHTLDVVTGAITMLTR